MYERHYGPKYNDLKALTGKEYATAADIAKLIRADLKAAVADGDLPTTFNDHPVSYAVTVDNYSGGRSIDISVRGIPEAARTKLMEPGDYGYRDHLDGYPVDIPEATALLKKLEGYLWAYNYDGSESQVDYFDRSYYGHANFESDFGAGERARKAAKAREAKANPKPKKVGPSKRELVNHLRYGHKRRYSDRDSIARLTHGHGFLHTHGHLEYDTNHNHDEDLLLAAAG
jgi:hypothetical protein